MKMNRSYCYDKYICCFLFQNDLSLEKNLFAYVIRPPLPLPQNYAQVF